MILRLATYNLFEGARTSYNRLVDFVRDNELDVICMQEVNGWQDSEFIRMQDFTDKALFAGYVYGNSNTEYKLATFSKHTPHTSNVYVEGFWHCAIETHIDFGGQELTVINVHLDPWQEAARQREITKILNAVDVNKPMIIIGDFNSLSRQDNYLPGMLEELQRRGITKFGQNELEYGVTDLMEQAGFIDIGARLDVMEPTVPTASAQDKDHEMPVRVDYIFASPSVAQCATDIHTIKSSLTDSISDHYPVIASFEIEPNAIKTMAVPATSAVTNDIPQPVPVIELPQEPVAPPPVAAKPVIPWTPPAEAVTSSPIISPPVIQLPPEPQAPPSEAEVIITH